MPAAPPPSSSSGLTLLEALFTTAVAVVLLAVGVPAFDALVLDTRRTAHVNDLVTAIQLARSHAIRSGRPVALCQSAAQQRCDGDEAGWHGGWMVFVNTDRDRPAEIDGGEQVLLRHGALKGATAHANRDAFQFRVFQRYSTNGTVVFCDRRGDRAARAVIVSTTGRPRVADRRADGTPLRCGIR